MADLEQPRIRSVVQHPQPGSPVTHWSRKERSRSRSRSRSPHERRGKREDKENRRGRDRDEEYDRERRHTRRDEEREYRKRSAEGTNRQRGRENERRERSRYDDHNSDDERHRHKRRGRTSVSDDGRNESHTDATGEGKEKLKDGAQAGQSDEVTRKKADPNNPLLSRTGGAYIPPAKLRMMQENIADKSSEAYQRLSWEALKKSINGLINKVNTSNIAMIVRELFQENIVRGRGVLAQSIIRAQAASPTFTHVYAALVAIINTKFPKNGELILRRLVLLFRRSYRRNAKVVCLSASRFIAHLVNQQVAHEILALEILTLLLHKPTDDSVEVAIGFLKECGMKLTEISPRGVNAVFERLRSILHSGDIDNRVQYMIEVMFAIRKDGFKDHLSVSEGLDLVEEEDQITHLLRLEEAGTTDDILNIFKFDPNFLANKEKYREIKMDILGEGGSDESSDNEDGDSEDDEDDEDDEGGNNEAGKMTILDQTETNLVALRRTVYLTIQSSLDYEECAHKLLKMQFKPEHVPELCKMIVDCCSQQRSYEKFFGLLAQRFCQLRKEYIDEFMKIFHEQYDSIHRLETNKLRNVAKLFAHLFYSDAIPWTVLACIKLNEDDTTSSSRVFIKILFQELAEFMGLQRLNERLKDPFLVGYFEGIFPRDNPRNTRFSINFFTTIGLGGVTDELREHLKNAPKMIMAQKRAEESDSDSDSDSSDSSSSSSEENSSSEDSSSEESSESDDSRERRRRRKQRTPPRKGKQKQRAKENKQETKKTRR